METPSPECRRRGLQERRPSQQALLVALLDGVQAYAVGGYMKCFSQPKRRLGVIGTRVLRKPLVVMLDTRRGGFVPRRRADDPGFVENEHMEHLSGTGSNTTDVDS